MRQNPKVQVGIIGECMVELRGELFGDLKQSWGGDTYNTAVYLRRLLPDDGFDVHYITGLGNDSLSNRLIENWQAENISTQHIQRIPEKTPGLYQISVDADGERSFLYWRNDSAAKYTFDDLSVPAIVELLSQFQWLYLSGISLAILTSHGRAKLLLALADYVKSGGKLSFDNNYRPILWHSISECQSAYRAILSLTEVALLTEDDEQKVWDLSSVDSIIANCPSPEIVVKRGSLPCVIKTQTENYQVSAKTVDKVVDTTAAGDSFAAGYLAGRLQGKAPDQSAQIAHSLASTVIQFPGAIIPISEMPTRI